MVEQREQDSEQYSVMGQVSGAQVMERSIKNPNIPMEDLSGSESDREEEKLDYVAPLKGEQGKKTGFFRRLSGVFGKKKKEAAATKIDY